MFTFENGWYQSHETKQFLLPFYGNGDPRIKDGGVFEGVFVLKHGQSVEFQKGELIKIDCFSIHQNVNQSTAI